MATSPNGVNNADASMTDGAGVLGTTFAALCCAGAPFIVSALVALGLSFLRSDAILLPLMGVSLPFLAVSKRHTLLERPQCAKPRLHVRSVYRANHAHAV